VEAISIHHLIPGRHKVLHKLLLRVRGGIDFREGAKLRVGAEDQVDAGTGPFDSVRFATAPLVHAFGASNRLPIGAHVEQVDEEVVRQSSRLLGEDAVLGAANSYAEDAQATEKNRHLRPGQRQQLRPIDAAPPARTIRSASETFLPPVAEALNSFWIASSFASTVLSCAGWFTSQSFCGSRRMRAPLAPPRLSEPRKVEAEAQAAETNSETERPVARIFAFRASMSLSSTSG